MDLQDQVLKLIERVNDLETEILNIRVDMSQPRGRHGSNRNYAEEAILAMMSELPKGVRLSAAAIMEAFEARTGKTSPSNSTVHKYCDSLVEKGLLKKIGEAKGTRYFVN